MKRHAPLLVLAGALLVLVVGLSMLFRLRLAHGDVFPEYSSLRSDPLGLRVLHDSLAQLPALRVERRFKPLDTLETAPPRTIVIAGIWPRGWDRVTRRQFEALDDAVKSGSRLVIAFRAKQAGRDDEDEEATARDFAPARSPKKKDTNDKKSDAKKKPEKSADKKGKGKDDPEEKDPEEDAWEKQFKVDYVDLEQRWGVAVKERFLMERAGNVALRGNDGRAAGLPLEVPWRSDQYFKPAADAAWRTLYKRASEPVLIERSRGRGTIVLASDAYFLSNEALQHDRAAPLLAWIIGPNANVVFDEAHLGVVVDPGVAALARRYGLSGAFFTLLLLAALFVWRRMALFVPPAPVTPELALSYHPAAGLEALLRRAVPADKVVTACTTEWAPTARASDRRRVDSALAEAKGSVVDRYNAAVRALRRR